MPPPVPGLRLGREPAGGGGGLHLPPHKGGPPGSNNADCLALESLRLLSAWAT